MLSVLIFKNTRGAAAAAAAITIPVFFAKAEKNPIQFPPREPPQNRPAVAEEMRPPGRCHIQECVGEQ